MRVCVMGALGRMGTEVCKAVEGDPELELVAAVDPRSGWSGDSNDLRRATGEPRHSAQVVPNLDSLDGSHIDVAVDFTEAAAARHNLRWCASHAVHAVVGTTGFSEDDLRELERLFGEPASPNCVLAPNFAIGAVLLEHLAEIAAPFMESVEIVELHHDMKLDAPSGTSRQVASAMARARAASGSGAWPGDRTQVEALAGSRGAHGPGGARIHSVRLRGLVAHHEVVFGAEGQSLSLRHDSFDRSCFMPGVLMAVKAVPQLPGLTVGLGPILGI